MNISLVLNKKVTEGKVRPWIVPSIAIHREDEAPTTLDIVSAELAMSARCRPDGTYVPYLPETVQAIIGKARAFAQGKILNPRLDKEGKPIGEPKYGGQPLPNGLTVLLTVNEAGSIIHSTLTAFPVTKAETVAAPAVDTTMDRILAILEGQAREIAALKAAK